MSLNTKFNKFICAMGLMLFCQSLQAQIQPVTTHYMFLPQAVNPAFYGSEDGIRFAANYRHQWAKLEGQPRTVSFLTDAYVPQLHGGVGLSVTNDMLGAYNNTSLNAGYAFVQDIRKKVKIGIGLNVGMTLSKLDGTKLITPQGDGGSLNDDALSGQMQTSIRPNLSMGISVTHKYVEVGLAYSNLINAKDKFDGENKSLQPQYGGVFQAYASSKVKAGENFSVRPSLLLRTDFREFQTEFSFMAGYKDFISVGFNVRGYNKKSFESLSPIINISPVKNFCIIYNFDVTLNKLNPVSKGSHEISLTYLLPNNKIYRNPKIVNNPRFL